MKRNAFSLVAGGLLCAALAASATTRYVNLNNPLPVAPYTNWLTAATNIQDAVDIAVAGDEIMVTNGVYQTGATVVSGMSNRVAVTKAVTVQSVNGAAVTSIAGSGPNGPAAVRCVYLTNGALLAGLTLTNGATQATYDPLTGSGGGIWCESPSAVVLNCVLSGNSAWFGGGGACAGTLNHCTLTGNSAETGGGATSATLNNCVLTNNSAFWDGGGASSSTLYNCLLMANSAGGGGGASSATLNNCTLTGNSAAFNGGGAYVAALNNCIVYYNTASAGWDYDDSSVLNFCCTESLPAGTGNFTNAPLFMDTNGWSNLRLQSNSPCINAGGNTYAPDPTDLDGNPRVAGGRVDIGAYEFQGTGLSGFNAWLWQYGLPTDGSADDADTDRDGHNNWQEWIAGTNPTNAVSALRLLSVTDAVSAVTVTWSSVTDRNYALEQATNLRAAPAFCVLQSNMPGLPDTTSWTDTNAVGTAPRFYRVRVEN